MHSLGDPPKTDEERFANYRALREATAMPIRNPYRPCGSFLTADKVAVLFKTLKGKREALQKFVDSGRMRRDNFDAEIGALEAVLTEFQDRLEAEQEVASKIIPHLPPCSN